MATVHHTALGADDLRARAAARRRAEVSERARSRTARRRASRSRRAPLGSRRSRPRAAGHPRRSQTQLRTQATAICSHADRAISRIATPPRGGGRRGVPEQRDRRRSSRSFAAQAADARRTTWPTCGDRDADRVCGAVGAPVDRLQIKQRRRPAQPYKSLQQTLAPLETQANDAWQRSRSRPARTSSGARAGQPSAPERAAGAHQPGPAGSLRPGREGGEESALLVRCQPVRRRGRRRGSGRTCSACS